MTPVDVVVVSYNSRSRLRACVAPLLEVEGVRVIVVDNASPDRSLEVVADLDIERLTLPRNGGFSYGCNAGWRHGTAPFVLLLNPDATIDTASLQLLVGALERDARCGAAAPRIVHGDGTISHSLRRFPRLRSTYAQALFLHRLLPRATWTDEVIRDPAAYARSFCPEWVSGACVLVRRTSLEALGGLDEGFFLYCEDIDLARRLDTLGQRIAFLPDAIATHAGGASTPDGGLLAVLAASRIRYAHKHLGRRARLEHAGIGLGMLTHAVAGRRGRRASHAHGFAVALVGALPGVLTVGEGREQSRLIERILIRWGVVRPRP